MNCTFNRPSFCENRPNAPLQKLLRCSSAPDNTANEWCASSLFPLTLYLSFSQFACRACFPFPAYSKLGSYLHQLNTNPTPLTLSQLVSFRFSWLGSSWLSWTKPKLWAWPSRRSPRRTTPWGTSRPWLPWLRTSLIWSTIAYVRRSWSTWTTRTTKAWANWCRAVQTTVRPWTPTPSK